MTKWHHWLLRSNSQVYWRCFFLSKYYLMIVSIIYLRRNDVLKYYFSDFQMNYCMFMIHREFVSCFSKVRRMIVLNKTKKSCIRNKDHDLLITSKILGVSRPAKFGYLFITLKIIKVMQRYFQETKFSVWKTGGHLDKYWKWLSFT